MVVCAGHPRDMGAAQGEALREAIRDAVRRAGLPMHRSRLPSLRALVSGPLRGRGAGREMFRHFAHQAERLEGLAQASDLPLDSLLALQLRVGAGDFEGLELGAAAWIVRESRPVVGFRSLERTLAWLVPAVAGVNEAGLAVMAPLQRVDVAAGTSSGARMMGCETVAPHGVDAPALLLVQDCLARFEHLAGALDWCRKRPAEGRQTIALGDATGARATVEFRGRERRVALGGGGELVGELLCSAERNEPIAVALDPVARVLRLAEERATCVPAEVGDRALTFGFTPLPPSEPHAA